jgi:uncharacterized protein
MKTLRPVMASFLALYLALCATVYALQGRLLYLPTVMPLADAERLAQERGWIGLRDREGTLLGWQLRPPSHYCAHHWLVTHGNGGMALDRQYLIEGLLALPSESRACVTVVEYPGYGASPGTPGAASLVARAMDAFDTVARDGVPVRLVGESLGTGVAGELAALRPQAAGVLLITPYDDLAEVAQGHYPWLPARWLLRDQLAPAHSLAEYAGPVALIIAGADKVIPPAHAERLASALTRPLVHRVAEAGHMDTYDDPVWWPRVVEWFHAHPDGGPVRRAIDATVRGKIPGGMGDATVAADG